MSGKKTIREAIHFVMDKINPNPDPVELLMALSMLKNIEKNLDNGKTINDEIEFD